MPLTPAMQITYFGVQCYDEGTKETWKTFGRSQATRTIVCAWQDRIPLINNIFSIGGLNNVNQPYYGPAAAYPDAPTLLFLETLDVEGIAGPNGLTTDPNGLVAYDLARCRLTFASYPYDQSNLNVTSLDYGVEEICLTQSGSSFYWNGTATTPVPPTQTPSIRVPSVTLTITQYNQTVLPTPTVVALIGTVNNATVIGCSAGTLMFAGAKSARRLAVNGTVNYDMTFQFTYLPVGWNKKFCNDPAVGIGWTPILDGAGNPPFTTASFSPLGIFNSIGNL